MSYHVTKTHRPDCSDSTKHETTSCLTNSVDDGAEVALLQDVLQLVVGVSATGVQVLPDCPAEEEGVLRNNGQPRPAGRTNKKGHRSIKINSNKSRLQRNDASHS